MGDSFLISTRAASFSSASTPDHLAMAARSSASAAKRTVVAGLAQPAEIVDCGERQAVGHGVYIVGKRPEIQSLSGRRGCKMLARGSA